jgi:glycosyltransferase involved in cell wall biosynthesis
LSTTTKHIVFLVSRLDEPGGTERANLNAAHLFIERGHKVSVIILDETDKSFYPIDDRIQIIHKQYYFGIGQKGNVLTRKWQLLKNTIGLRRLIKQLHPDVIISTDYPYSVALVLAGCHTLSNVFSWEHHHYHWLQKNTFWRAMIRRTYPKLKGVLVYNTDETGYYEAFGCKVTVVPNYLAEVAHVTQNDREKTILTVGWLIKRKGVDMIPAIANEFLHKYPDWKWKIVGTGELKHDIQRQIIEYDLADQLLVVEPERPLIPADYQKVSLFVMTSRLEPFGLVLIEAMSNKVPCIAFDCKTGPRHIITNKEDGFLVELEDIQAMAQAIETLITDNARRVGMGIKAGENVLRFSADSVYQLWEKVLYAE